jgi:hypothetical protein
VELYLHSPNTPSWRGAQLKHRNNFTFTLLLPLTSVYGNIMCLKNDVLRKTFEPKSMKWVIMILHNEKLSDIRVM